MLPYLQVSGLIECCKSGSIARVVKGVMSFSSNIVLVVFKVRLCPFCVIYFCGIEKEIMINDWGRGGRRRRRQREEGISGAGVGWC